MKIFWRCLIGLIALVGIFLLCGAVGVMIDEHKTRELIREGENIPNPILIYGLAVDTELGPAVVNSEGKHFYFEEGFIWKSGQVGSRVSGSGVLFRKRYQENSLELKKSQRGLLLYQPELHFTETE